MKFNFFNMLRLGICFVTCLYSLLLSGSLIVVRSENIDYGHVVTGGIITSSKTIATHENAPVKARSPHDNHNHGEQKDSNAEEKADNNQRVYDIQMSNVTTDGDDVYLCIDWTPSFSGKHFITRFEATPDDPNVHHMLLFACSGSSQKLGKAGSCGSDCQPNLVYFAWARNAPPTNLPEGIGFVIGSDGIDYLQLQVHYRTMVAEPDQTKLSLTVTSDLLPYSAGVLLLSSTTLVIPANREKVIGSVSCLFKDNVTLHPFAFRTHTHMLGKVLSGYVVHNSEWTNIGRGNPNWPQAFWPAASNNIIVKSGDYLVAKCVYSSKGYNVEVGIGATHNDEMCNFYMMYYQSSGEPRPTTECYNDQFPDVSAKAPAEAIELLPPNPALDALGEGQSSEHQHNHHHHHSHNNNNMATENIHIEPVGNWPNFSDTFRPGQVSGVSIDDAFVYVLHRGSAKWDGSSFDSNNVYRKKDNGPIKENVLVLLNSTTGVPVSFWGKNFFHMPHGLHVDKGNVVWITDVAMHQVFKFQLPSKPSDDAPHPDMTLGSAFDPGSDRRHFCKPAGVVTNLTGYVFVADGYCNNRVVVFDRFGSFMASWEISSGPGLPHSITVDQTREVVYVADRINAKIWGFHSSGNLIKQIQHESFKPELFALAYSSARERLFCVNGQISTENAKAFHVAVVDPEDGTIESTWDLPRSHDATASPHDVAVGPRGDFVVVAVLDDPGELFKYDSAMSGDFGLGALADEKSGVAYRRRPVGKFGKEGRGFDPEENRKYKLTLIFVVVLCLFVIPLSVLVGMSIYFRNKQKIHEGYSHLEAAQQVNRRYNGKSTGDVIKTFVTGKASIPETIKEEELKRLESESDEEEFSIQDFKSGQI